MLDCALGNMRAVFTTPVNAVACRIDLALIVLQQMPQLFHYILHRHSAAQSTLACYFNATHAVVFTRFVVLLLVWQPKPASQGGNRDVLYSQPCIAVLSSRVLMLA